MIYHITSQIQWQQAQLIGHYESVHFKSEGFIHASTSVQVEATANRIFKAHTDLILLAIDENLLNCEVIFENLDGGNELYPHIYGLLPVSAVITTYDIDLNDNGYLTVNWTE